MIKKDFLDPKERSTWRSGVRSTMHAASQLPGKRPIDVGDALHLQVNKKSDYDYDDDSVWCLDCNAEVSAKVQSALGREKTVFFVFFQ